MHHQTPSLHDPGTADGTRYRADWLTENRLQAPHTFHTWWTSYAKIKRCFLPQLHPEYFCPLSQCIMTHPVLAPDGYIYQAKAIADYLRTHTHSPMTGQPMSHTRLAPLCALQDRLLLFQAQHAEVLSQLEEEHQLTPSLEEAHRILAAQRAKGILACDDFYGVLPTVVARNLSVPDVIDQDWALLRDWRHAPWYDDAHHPYAWVDDATRCISGALHLVPIAVCVLCTLYVSPVFVYFFLFLSNDWVTMRTWFGLWQLLISVPMLVLMIARLCQYTQTPSRAPIPVRTVHPRNLSAQSPYAKELNDAEGNAPARPMSSAPRDPPPAPNKTQVVPLSASVPQDNAKIAALNIFQPVPPNGTPVAVQFIGLVVLLMCVVQARPRPAPPACLKFFQPPPALNNAPAAALPRFKRWILTLNTFPEAYRNLPEYNELLAHYQTTYPNGVPCEYVDQKTYRLMEHPVLFVGDHRIYDRATLKDNLMMQKESPVTHKFILESERVCIPLHTLRSALSYFTDHQIWKVDPDSGIPLEYLDAHKLNFMDYPVVLMGDGHCYNKATIGQWFQTNPPQYTSPLTGVHLNTELERRLIPLPRLHYAIGQFMKLNEEYRDYLEEKIYGRPETRTHTPIPTDLNDLKPPGLF